VTLKRDAHDNRPWLPVLDAVTRAAGNQLLAGWGVVAVQHLQQSLVPLIEGLHKCGVAYQDIVVVSKSYSTGVSALDQLHLMGVTVVDPMRMTDPTVSYERELSQRVEHVLDDVLGLRVDRLLVLDEGAVASRVLATLNVQPGTVVVVEQTTRGSRWSSLATLPFPVVDVARSRAKSELETPMIVQAMLDGLAEILEETGRQSRASTFGVVGYGTIGRGLARELRSTGNPIVVCEIESGTALRAHTDGIECLDMPSLVSSVDVLIGCTGLGVVHRDLLERIDRDALLVNGASSDIEYPLWPSRVPERIVAGGTDANTPWCSHYSISDRHSVVLAAGGFPVNFYGDTERINAFDFQVTRGLMLAGAVQARKSTTHGVEPLHMSWQRLVTDSYLDATGHEGRTS
jgi:adenosylhomocysteinase